MLMRVCYYHPHILAIGLQLYMPKWLYAFGIFQTLGIAMYWAPKYM